MSTARIVKCRYCGQRLGNWRANADGSSSCGQCGRLDERTLVQPGTWRCVRHGTAEAVVPIFVVHVSERGSVYYVKPNPWALREGDTRAGWTKQQVCKVAEVLAERPTAAEVDAIVRAIGLPKHRAAGGGQ